MGLGVATQQASIGLPARPRQFWRQSVLPCLVLILATIAVYYPVHHHPFFGIDDPSYVTKNPYVLAPLNWGSVAWAFTHNYCLNYDPLIFFVHNLDVRLFHLDPGLHHDVNIAFHALNALLLFLVLKRCTGYTGRSFMVAALFALHPINVENVAWVAELKTLLSTAFFLLALDAYRWYALRPRLRRMAIVALLYLMGLLAKPQVITLPFLFLLWDYWPLRRMFAADTHAALGTSGIEGAPARTVPALIKEKIPLFIVAAIDAVITMFAEHKAVPEDWPYTFSIRLGNAILSYSRYLGKAFWPAHLGYLYPHPGNSLRWGLVWASFVLLIAITAVVLGQRRRRYLLVGWLWFLGNMVPMMGLVQIDAPALADRWAYTGFVGVFLMVCWSAAEWAQGQQLRQRLVQVTSIAVLLVLAMMSRHQVGYWTDDLTVWQHSLEINHRNWVADVIVGNILEMHGQHDEALKHLYHAAEDAPDDPGVDLGIALAEHRRGNLQQAVRYYDKALLVSKDTQKTAQIWADMGHAYSELGDTTRASECYQAALRIRSLPAPAAPPLPRTINWRGAWWHDIGPYLRQRWQQYRADDPH